MHAPPFALVRISRPSELNRIVPSRFQVPPAWTPTSVHRNRGTPPETAMVFNVRSVNEKYAIVRLSGDQNGARAVSGPVSTFTSPVSSERTAILRLVVYASIRPSGDRAMNPGAALFGNSIETCRRPRDAPVG